MKSLLCICVLAPIYHLPSFLLLSLLHSGAQGEFAGLCAIMAYHRDRGEEHRKVRIPLPPLTTHSPHTLTHTLTHPYTLFFLFFSPSSLPSPSFPLPSPSFPLPCSSSPSFLLSLFLVTDLPDPTVCPWDQPCQCSDGWSRCRLHSHRQGWKCQCRRVQEEGNTKGLI